MAKLIASGKFYPEGGGEGCTFTIEEGSQKGTVQIIVLSCFDGESLVDDVEIEESEAMSWLIGRANY